jgi:Ner family transcriptional regulator
VHPQIIIAELRRRGTNASKIAAQNKKSRTWAIKAIHGQLQSARAESAVAMALGLKPWNLWPDRYHSDGTRIDGRAERHRNPTGWARRRNRLSGKAA